MAKLMVSIDMPCLSYGDLKRLFIDEKKKFLFKDGDPKINIIVLFKNDLIEENGNYYFELIGVRP